MSTITNPAPDPSARRWMVFVDGENLTLRGQAIARENNVELTPGKHYSPDVFLWTSLTRHATVDLYRLIGRGLNLQDRAVRAIYYTSAIGDDSLIAEVKMSLWNLGFSPVVGKKSKKHAKAKGVDIALTTDLLSNAYMNNYDVAVVLTGDADYVPALDEVRRLGKAVCVVAFEGTDAVVKPELKLSSDYFVPANDFAFIIKR